MSNKKNYFHILKGLMRMLHHPKLKIDLVDGSFEQAYIQKRFRSQKKLCHVISNMERGGGGV